MRPHPRIRKVVKWGGLVPAAMIAVIGLTTAWVGIEYHTPRGHSVGLDTSQFRLTLANSLPQTVEQGFFGVWSYSFSLGWQFAFSQAAGTTTIAIPLWFPLLLTALPTALAWRLDTLARRREKMNACPSCGYDRSGIAPSSPCPECGKECAGAAAPPPVR